MKKFQKDPPLCLQLCSAASNNKINQKKVVHDELIITNTHLERTNIHYYTDTSPSNRIPTDQI